jgi:hypothetical protein
MYMITPGKGHQTSPQPSSSRGQVTLDRLDCRTQARWVSCPERACYFPEFTMTKRKGTRKGGGKGGC